MRTQAVVVKQTTQYLTFMVASEEYAIPILRVREIFAYVPLTRIPRAPAFIAGVMNLRGTVVPVVDLRVKLGLSETTITPWTCIIIVDVDGEQGATTMGLLSEEVKKVMELVDEEVEAPPTFGTLIDVSFLLGMGDLGDHFALILNVDKVLSTLELIAASRAVEEATTVVRTVPETMGAGRKRKRARQTESR